MNRSAYLTTSLAIKALSNLTKANIVLHGTDHIPDGPTIFVINHFTRIETFLLPHHIYNLTDKPACSLAHSSLFQGGLGTFFEMVGVVSTSHPQRDELIIRSLLTDEANWIIFPEGSMVKTKQIMQGGKYMVTNARGMRRPHTGAAALALRCELSRRYLLHKGKDDEEAARGMLEFLDIESLDEVVNRPTTIVPVNLTYYPIRARENIVLDLAAKMVKDLPERMVEEIMTEGTMLLSGVDIDVRFGDPIEIEPYLEQPKVKTKLEQQDLTGLFMTASLKETMKELAEEIMQRYMAGIYAMTTVNHEHLFATFLRMYPFKKFKEGELRKRVFMAATRIADMDSTGLFLHNSLRQNQSHLLTDDRYQKFDNFYRVAQEKGILSKTSDGLEVDRSRLSTEVSFHRGRIDNPIEIMANEVEPLKWLRKLLLPLALQPDFLLHFNMLRFLWRRERQSYEDDYRKWGHGDDLERKSFGKPFLMPGVRRKVGVVLIHSYLASPEEVRKLANQLWRQGLWVYALRLPGHGTSSKDLAGRKHTEWLEAAETAYLLVRSVCDKVVFCGISVGAGIALEVAGRAPDSAGVVAICPPLKLADYSNTFMPSGDVWDRMVKRIKRDDSEQFLEFTADNPHVNYRKNPLSGIKEVDHLLEVVQDRLPKLTKPTLIIQSGRDPLLHPKSVRKVFTRLGGEDKQFCLFNFDRHIIINGEGSRQVHRTISNFIKGLAQR